jgi:hypothetical protein
MNLYIMQKILSNWDDLLICLSIVWIWLMYAGYIAYPNERVRINFEKMKRSKWNPVYRVLYPALFIIFLAKAIFD